MDQLLGVYTVYKLSTNTCSQNYFSLIRYFRLKLEEEDKEYGSEVAQVIGVSD